jgi:hypothetical protein
VTTIIIGLLLVVLGTIAYVALRNAQDFSDANEVIPGVATRAPKEWAGAHSQEARLHRRLRDTMVVLRENASLDDPSLAPARSALEREALAIDDALIGIAALPKHHREAHMTDVASAVEAVEEAVAGVVAMRGPALGEARAGVADVQARLALIAAAREELAALAPGATSLDALAEGLEAQAPPVAPPPAPPPMPRGDEEQGGTAGS